MPRILYLHIGPSKTGTSAIQAYFKEQAHPQIHYPLTGQWHDGSHHRLMFAHQQIPQYGETVIPAWPDLLKALDNELSLTEKSVLISSEHCEPEFINALSPLLIKYKLKIKVIVVFRHPLERAASTFNQQIKDPAIGLNLLPDEFLAREKQRFKARILLEKWLLPEISAVLPLPFEANEPLVERFCKLLGIDGVKVTNKIYNRSMADVGIVSLLISNTLYNTDADRRQLFKSLRESSGLKLWKSYSFPFSQTACKDFMDAYQDDIDWATSEIGITLNANPEDKPRFCLSTDDAEQIRNYFYSLTLSEKQQQHVDTIIREFS